MTPKTRFGSRVRPPLVCRGQQPLCGTSAEGVCPVKSRTDYDDVLQTAAGWQKFAAGWLVGGLSGVAWAYILTQTLPYYR